MVANSIPANLLRRTDATVPKIRAISDPGTFLVTLLQLKHITRQSMLMANSIQLMLPRFWK